MTVDRSDPYDVKAAVLDLMGEMTAEERAEVFGYFCARCAFPVAACRCRKEAWHSVRVGNGFEAMQLWGIPVLIDGRIPSGEIHMAHGPHQTIRAAIMANDAEQEG